MSDFEDDDIVQDFLVESREILESLGEQLVELEQRGDDTDLLNAVFRGFHTIKGGAGFLALDPLVDICHRTEDLFNLLRNGQRQITPNLMDHVLRALDVVNGQFDALDAGKSLQPAPAALLLALEELIKHGETAKAAPAATAEPAPASEPAAEPAPDNRAETKPESATPPAKPAQDGSDEITDDEFEALLDSLEASASAGSTEPAAADGGKAAADGGKPPPATASYAGSEEQEISEDEFEAMLDELHGKGRHGAVAPEAAPPAATTGSSDGDMSDDEFEGLLDSLQSSRGGISHTPDHTPGPTPGHTPDTGSNAGTAALDNAGTATLDATDKPPVAAPTAATRPAASPQPVPAAQAVQASRAAREEPPAGDDAQPGRAARGETTVRVDTARLDDIMNLVGELVLVRNRLITQCETLGNEQVGHTVADLELVTADLQAAVMKTRMQPIKKVYGRFPRLVRDLARDLGKEIALEMVGEDTDLDKNLVEAIADPLIHLVRNSCDHGIEMPEVRLAAGKPRQGKLLLSAAQEGDRILLVIADDGGGMDPEKLREKAIEKGVLDRESAARLDDRECFNLIFLPGFSTKDEISDVSGRGVGMDVVRTRIAQLNGTIEIDSRTGVGTTLKVRVPLTLAILPTLMVRIGSRKFAMPMSVVSEIFALDQKNTREVDGRRVVLVRHKAMPLYYLERWINSVRGWSDGAEDQADKEQQVVSVVLGHQPIGLIVDEVIGLEEVVIKPLGSMLHGLPGLAGSTTTGDGRIALIIDIPSLIKSCGSAM